jgi:hypothetical protein
MPIHTIHTLVSPRYPDRLLMRFLVTTDAVSVLALTRDMGGPPMGGSWIADNHWNFWDAPEEVRRMIPTKEKARDVWRTLRNHGWIDSSELPEDELRRLQGVFPYPLNGAVA